MNNKIEGTFSIVAALLVLLTAMLDPRISIMLAIIALVGMAIYQFVIASKQN